MSFPNTINSVPVGNVTNESLSPLWSKVRGLVLKTVVVSVVVAGLIAAAAALFGSFGEVHIKALATIILVVALALLAWFDAEVSTNKGNNFALAGLFTSLFLLVAGLYKIWLQDYLDPQNDVYAVVVVVKFFQLLWVLVILRLALLIGSWLVNTSRRYETAAIKATAIGTLVLISITAFLFILPLVISHVEYGEFYWRAMWASVILTAVGSALVPLCVGLFGPKTPKANVNVQVNNGYNQYGQNFQPANPYSSGYPAQQPTGYPAYDHNQYAPEGPVQPQQGQGTQPGVYGGYASQNQAQPLVDPIPPVLYQQNIPQPPPIPVEPPKRKLSWPTYEDGTPLPSKDDGTPDYSGL
jgi:hypothetical protein